MAAAETKPAWGLKVLPEGVVAVNVQRWTEDFDIKSPSEDIKAFLKAREALEFYSRFATAMDREGRRGMFRKYSRAKMLAVQEKYQPEWDKLDIDVVICAVEDVHMDKTYVVTSWIELIDKNVSAAGYTPKEKYRLHIEPCKHVPPGLCVPALPVSLTPHTGPCTHSPKVPFIHSGRAKVVGCS
eukprot:7994319-Pyramimonas_sp.AAC.1